MNNAPQWKNQLDKLMKPLAKNAWAPKLEECDPMYEGSKYFGIPWMPKGGRWPTFEKTKMTFLLQLDLSELPAEMTDQLGIKEGLLQFFRSDEGYSENYKDSLVRIVNPTKEEGGYKKPSKSKNNPQPPTPEEMAKFKSYSFKELYSDREAIRLKDKIHAYTAAAGREDRMTKGPAFKITSWEKFNDCPHFNEFSKHEKGALFPELEVKFEELDDVAEADIEEPLWDTIYYSEDDQYDIAKYQCQDTDKLGGYPCWVQGIETPVIKKEKMKMFMQLSQNGHGAFDIDGNGQIFFLPSDPTVLKFVWACT